MRMDQRLGVNLGAMARCFGSGVAQARWQTTLRVVGLLAAPLLLACTPDFDDVTEVKDLRVLAMRAEPPEILFALPPVSNDQIPEVRIDVLAVDPRDPDREVSWRAVACTPEEGDCLVAAMTEEVSSGTTRLDAISFAFRPSIELLNAALVADPLRGFGGLPIIVQVSIEDQQDGYTVSAVKRVAYTAPLPYSPLPPGKTANQNPSLVGLEAALNGADNETLDLAKVVQLRTEDELKLDPQVSPESKQDYVVTVFDLPEKPGEVPFKELEEFLTYHYFADAGSLSHAKTGGAPSPFFDNKKVDDTTSDWNMPQEAEEFATVWVVVSDGRGGIDWLSLRAQVAAQ